MADPTDRAQFGVIENPKRKDLWFSRTVFVRSTTQLFAGTAQGLPATQAFSTIPLRSELARRNRLRRLTLVRCHFPRKAERTTKSESLRWLPRHLSGGQPESGMWKHPRLWFFDVYMNVKFGAKTRPC